MENTTNKPFTLRLPVELYEPIAQMAQRERRSLHNQVLYLLDRAVEAIEEAEDIRDAAIRLAANEEAVPLEQVLAEIDQRRAQKVH